MRNRFVTAVEPVRLMLADVHVRAHKALIDRKKPEATLEELQDSQARVDAALADGAWIEIKPELTAGETRIAQTRAMAPQSDDDVARGARPRVDYRNVGFARLAMYLLGWNIEDEHGLVEIPMGDDESAIAARETLLKRLDEATFAEIAATLAWYEAETEKRRAGNPTAPPASAATFASRA
jgi:hypothetical protein